MTPMEALKALKAFTEENIAPLLNLMKEPQIDNTDFMEMQEQEQGAEFVHPYVEIGDVPHKNFMPVDFQCPMILWTLDETSDSGSYSEGRTISIRAYVSTYGGEMYRTENGEATKLPDNKAFVDLMNTLETMYQKISANPTLGGRLMIQKPITYGKYDGAFYPYAYGYFQAQAELPTFEANDFDSDFDC
jgi:hypothetical protein